MIRRSVQIVIALGLLAFAAGCHMTPVPAHVRGPLAHPTMIAEDMTIGLDGHVRSVSEGAAGSLSGGGGGCGCN